MKSIKNIGIIAAVAIVAAAIMWAKQFKKTGSAKAESPVAAAVVATAPQEEGLPKLVDLGASKCIPCKMMKPILDDLKANYADTFKTEFIDVWEDGEAGKAYGINLIPTQIFFGADGKEEQNVTFRMASGCQNIRAFAEALTAKGPVDGYAEIGAGSAGVVLSTSRETLKGCCAGCVVPSAVFKAMQVASGVALPKNIALAFIPSQPS